MTRKYSNRQLNEAGNVLRNPSEFSRQQHMDAADILTYWRTIHAAPINTFQATLRDKIYNLKIRSAIIAQRLKRAASVISKLNRFDHMQLARMQDIAGLRAVLSTVEDVKLLQQNYLASTFKHTLVNDKDYILTPQSTGYRGVHLIYQYNNPKVPESNGLRIELQLRTRLQHVWATAVETVGTFLGHSLKSSQGPEEWLEFFALVSAGFAILENCPKPAGYNHLSDDEIFERIVQEADRLKIAEQLSYFSIAAGQITQSKKHGKYNLIKLDVGRKNVEVYTYTAKELEEVNKEYTKLETEIAEGANFQVVLVSTSSVEALRKAYPSYFLDTKEFLNHLETIRNAGDGQITLTLD